MTILLSIDNYNRD